jgi:hypothetical protein
MNIKIKKIAIGTLTFLILGLASFLYQSCTESVNSPENEPFSFKVKVVDSNENPLSNLKIGVCFHFTDQFMEKKLLKNVKTNYGNTEFLFSVKSACKLTLTAYDLENKEVVQIIHNENLNAGIGPLFSSPVIYFREFTNVF